VREEIAFRIFLQPLHLHIRLEEDFRLVLEPFSRSGANQLINHNQSK
jgi:hypothetical protein